MVFPLMLNEKPADYRHAFLWLAELPRRCVRLHRGRQVAGKTSYIRYDETSQFAHRAKLEKSALAHFGIGLQYLPFGIQLKVSLGWVNDNDDIGVIWQDRIERGGARGRACRGPAVCDSRV